LLAAGLGLGLIGVCPDYLFPLLWVAPLIILLALKIRFKDRHLLNPERGAATGHRCHAGRRYLRLFMGDVKLLDLVKWHYVIPFVDRFHLFEMPILGYAGYLLFGLEYAVVGESVRGWHIRFSADRQNPLLSGR